MAMVKLLTRILSGVAIGLLVVILVGIATWQIDFRRQQDQVMRGVAARGIELGGVRIEQVEGRLSPIVDEIENAIVTISSDGTTFEIPAGELGVNVDTEAMAERAATARRDGGPMERLRSWVDSYRDTERIGLEWSLDRRQTRQRLLAEPAFANAAPREPSLSLENGTIEVDRGREGRHVNIDAAVNDFVEAYRPFNNTTIEVTTRIIPRKLNPQVLVRRKNRIEGILRRGLRVEVGEESMTLTSNILRELLVLRDSKEGQVIRFVGDGLGDIIEDAIDEEIAPATDPTFEVVDGEPRVVSAGTVPQICCADGSQKLLVDALNRGDEKIELESVPSEDPTDQALASGEWVTEQVSSFTTEHACCESRVANIHRFADLTQGVYLNPGESVSLNGHVGERTEEKGFVSGGFISRGRLVQDIGGGVSQYATTIFNAAFFAGLDFDTYQSHSLYISRYPRGREATISFPAPDLEINNSTDYPVLIWNSYTDTSITVSMYSTENVRVLETGQSEGTWGEVCTKVDTFRQRTYSDGSEVGDSVFAIYRPDEGISCDGTEIPAPED